MDNVCEMKEVCFPQPIPNLGEPIPLHLVGAYPCTYMYILLWDYASADLLTMCSMHVWYSHMSNSVTNMFANYAIACGYL